MVRDFERGTKVDCAPAPHAALLALHGLLEAANGDHAAAAATFGDTSAAWSDIGRPLPALLAGEHQARAELAAGDHEAAVRQLRSVERGLRALGARWDADRVARALREQGVEVDRVWRGGRRGYGHELSPRELEVARMVAQGLTNRQVAEALFLSPRTVERHLGAAMRKLGITGRSTLARLVAESGLPEGEPPQVELIAQQKWVFRPIATAAPRRPRCGDAHPSLRPAAGLCCSRSSSSSPSRLPVGGLGSGGAAAAPDRPTAPTAPTGDATASEARVTLLTGDVVAWHRSPSGKQGASVVDPAVEDSRPAVVYEQDGQVHVVPAEALPYVQSGVLDENLFNVTLLVQQQARRRLQRSSCRCCSRAADDRRQGEHRRHPTRPTRCRSSTRSAWSRSTAPKDEIRTVWESLRGEQADLTATDARLAGAGKVWLNGTVRATLDDSVPQIDAPEAWAQGYDGTGATVAVLDTGYDPEHPDLAGQVKGAQDFTGTSEGAVDDNGHGTHVASTVAGTGAASSRGEGTGVAPGADAADRQGARRRRLRHPSTRSSPAWSGPRTAAPTWST